MSKTDVVVSRSGSNRAEIEAKRGIIRDTDGKIVRTPAWRKERIAHLEAKIEDFKTRTKNAQNEIKEQKKDLAK